MRTFFFGLLTLLTTTLTAQKNQFDPEKKYHPDSLRRWTTSIMDGISEKHPGFYRYTSKQRFDYLIDSTAQTLNDSLTTLDFYRKMKPLYAQIGCLHTGISLPGEYEIHLDSTSSLLPLEIFIDLAKKVLVSRSYDTHQHIPIGSEIISVNGRSISFILNTLLNAIPSDGYNETEKLLLLNHRFAFWYRSMIEVTHTFNVEVKTNRQIRRFDLSGVSSQPFPTFESLESGSANVLEFVIKDSTAILKVRSFAKTTIKDNGQNFKKFMKAAYKTMYREGIKNLVLDLRYNTGGSDGNAALLASYFFDEPFRYWARIEVTEAVAMEIKGINRLFYKKPVKRDSLYHWRKTWLTKEFDYYEPQKPARNNFAGNTYIITNGLCLSSCADFTAVLSHNGKATVVGQETGGGYQGNTSGMMPTAKIPTGLQVTVPLQKYTNAVDPGKNFGRGTIPDHIVTPTFDDWIAKEDVEMVYVLKLIKQN